MIVIIIIGMRSLKYDNWQVFLPQIYRRIWENIREVKRIDRKTTQWLFGFLYNL